MEEPIYSTLNTKWKLTVQWKDKKDLTTEQYEEMRSMIEEMKEQDENISD